MLLLQGQDTANFPLKTRQTAVSRTWPDVPSKQDIDLEWCKVDTPGQASHGAQTEQKPSAEHVELVVHLFRPCWCITLGTTVRIHMYISLYPVGLIHTAELKLWPQVLLGPRRSICMRDYRVLQHL